MKKLLKKHFSFIIAVLMVISLIIIPRTAQAASVKLNKTKLTMNVGGVYHLKVSGTNKKVTWSSTDSKVASVSSGKVKAKKTGTATITAKIGSKKLKCQIKIKDQRALYEKVLLQSGGKFRMFFQYLLADAGSALFNKFHDMSVLFVHFFRKFIDM